MSTYQYSVCFYICDLNLEVIEKFQANNYGLHTGKRLYHLPMEISGNSPRNFWSNGKRPWTRKNIPESDVSRKIIGQQIGKVIYGVSTKTES